MADYKAKYDKQQEGKASGESQAAPECHQSPEVGVKGEGSGVVCLDINGKDGDGHPPCENGQVVPNVSCEESQGKEHETRVNGCDASVESGNVEMKPNHTHAKMETDGIARSATATHQERNSTDNESCSSWHQQEGSRETTGESSKEEASTGADASSGDASSATTQKPSIVDKYFGGKSTTFIRCHQCNCISSRTETFFDLPLAFPESKGKTMLGGESNTDHRERVETSKNLGGSGASGGAGGVRSPDVPMVTVRQPSQEQVVFGPWPKPSSYSEGGGANSYDDPCKQNSQTTLQEMISHYLTPEVLTGDNKYRCENCQSLQDAEKSIEIVTPPRVLVLSLMRFSFDVKTQQRCKILTDVQFPRVLRLQLKHRNGDDAMETDCEQEYSATKLAQLQAHQHHPPCTKRVRANTTESPSNELPRRHLPPQNDQDPGVGYVLTAVIVHSGLSSESGHYYCYARHSERLGHMKLKLAHTQPSTSMLPNSTADNADGSSSSSGGGNGDEDQDPLPDRWYLFNDSRVSFSSYESFGNVTKRFPKDTAYLLFYQQMPDNGVDDDDEDATMAEMGTSAEGTSSSSSSNIRERPLRKDLLESVRKDNAMYLQVNYTKMLSCSVRNKTKDLVFAMTKSSSFHLNCRARVYIRPYKPGAG